MKQNKEEDPRLGRMTRLLALGAVLLLTAVFAVFTVVDIDSAESAMNRSIEYVRKQCEDFGENADSDLVKSLFRLSDKAQDISRDIASGGAPDSGTLEKLADEQQITGIILLTKTGERVCEFSSDRSGYAYWQTVIMNESILNIWDCPFMVYSERLSASDEYCYDYCAVARQDAPGVVFCYLRQSRDLLESGQLSLRSMLSGYGITMNGTVAVTDGEHVTASNNAALLDDRVSDCAVISALGQGEQKSGLTMTLNGGKLYFGSQSRCRGNYIYIYYNAVDMFSFRRAAVAYTAVAYALLWAALYIAYRHSRKLHNAQRRAKEAQYQEQLLSAAREAERANAAKTDFLRRMSHDIRTPINGIRGMLEIAEHYSNDPERQRECREKIWNASGYLLELVNDVLDMNKLESGVIVLEERAFDLNGIFSDIMALLVPQAQERRITIDLDCQSGIHTRLIGSCAHLKRLLVNVIGNAVKYSHDGGIVRVKCREASCDGGRALLEFSCEDYGIGMSEEFQKKMFEPFQQESITARSSYEGNGLGLSIAKILCEKMGGTIACSSEKDRGTKFVMTIPFTIDDSGSAEEEYQTAPAPIRGLRILLAEDNELNMEITEFAVKSQGADVVKAWNGREALELFEASGLWDIDVILMDLMMPEMNGFEAARRIRALDRPDASSVLILALTANVFAEDRREAEAAGMNGHLSKPITSQRLGEAIARGRKKAQSGGGAD